MSITVQPGSPFPLGATWDGRGVNFALYAENATAVELCLFDSKEQQNESERIKVDERTHHVWHIYIPGLKPGQLYGYRVYGRYEPEHGHRFNPNKFLIDPYAKAISDTVHWHDSLFGYEVGHPDADLTFSGQDSVPFMPRCVVIDPTFDWQEDKFPKIPYHKTIIYELHVKGFTKLHPHIPENIRGTYSSLAHPAVINYLRELGITAVELMPIHYFISDRQLEERGKTNYWGYNTIGFFAPDVRYSSNGHLGEQVFEFKNMVKELHKAGIEVFLDVVYNHTGEGNHLGPTLSFRGVDNASYYRLTHDKRYYMDYTGTGNTLSANLPNVLRLIMDSLRYWILEMHVDGFRFDLASTLARELHEVDRLGSFFDIIHQDPVISQVKLIAEPWDIGEGGYMVGNFPPGWAEWNGKYRDCMRDYWRGANSMLSEFAQRLTGSSDLYKNDYRHPTASVNFITAHDGFTLNDLVSYNEKHNEANDENNNDGENHNRSWNCGAEGPTDDPAILALRNRQKRNFLTTLFLSQGVPMLLAGDEMGRTQNGNNNPYCQDNEISWINWQEADIELLEFTKKLIRGYKDHNVFSRRDWFKGQPIKGRGLTDIAWFSPDGKKMNEENWKQDFAKCLAVYLNGRGIHSLDYDGKPIVDDNFYLIFNAHSEPVEYKLPTRRYGAQWIKVIDTNTNFVAEEEGERYRAAAKITVEGFSVVVL
ncbi:MAG: glycogen debranching protein GlgX [Bacteroidetes bacterium]|nr:MAG: glycogen debranching protein GlgX [Bacteroidota bacterium]